MPKKQQNKRRPSRIGMKSPLEAACDATPDLNGCFCLGLGALKSCKDKICADNPRKLTGSVDIDGSLVQKYPEDNRWDYAVEHNGKTIFVEIHPATSGGELNKMIAKVDWLKNWIRESAPVLEEIRAKDQPYYWVITNRFYMIFNTPEKHKLALNNIKIVKILTLK